MTEQRLDSILVLKKMTVSRTQAQRLIADGQVEIKVAGKWRMCKKASQKYEDNVDCRLLPGSEQKYVSRAGLKLAGAIAHSGLQVAGMAALDIGQSTGGFTDCLLKKGVAKVVGIDVGHSQLAAPLRNDARVECLEGINGRAMPVELLLSYVPSGFNLVVMDVSFISQKLILPGIPPLLQVGGYLVSLVKPQFEVGREGIGKGGVVRNSKLYPPVQENLCKLVTALGMTVEYYFESPLTGGDGNREFFLIAKLNKE